MLNWMIKRQVIHKEVPIIWPYPTLLFWHLLILIRRFPLFPVIYPGSPVFFSSRLTCWQLLPDSHERKRPTPWPINFSDEKLNACWRHKPSAHLCVSSVLWLVWPQNMATKSSVRVLVWAWLRDKGHSLYMFPTTSCKHNGERGHLCEDKQRLLSVVSWSAAHRCNKAADLCYL